MVNILYTVLFYSILKCYQDALSGGAKLRSLLSHPNLFNFYAHNYKVCKLMLFEINSLIIFCRGNLEESIPYAEDAVDIYTKINPDYYARADPIADLGHSYLLLSQPQTALMYFQKIYDMKQSFIENHQNECYLSGALEHIVRLNIEVLEVNLA